VCRKFARESSGPPVGGIGVEGTGGEVEAVSTETSANLMRSFETGMVCQSYPETCTPLQTTWEGTQLSSLGPFLLAARGQLLRADE
jgi:hypothetical protein